MDFRKGFCETLHYSVYSEMSEISESTVVSVEHPIEEHTGSILHGNCIRELGRLPANSVDLVVADPPYNLSSGSTLSWDNDSDLDGFGGDWDITDEDWDEMTHGEYVKFTEQWLAEAKRVLNPDGAIWVFGTYHNSGIVNVAAQSMGYHPLNEIVWFKRNAFPNLQCNRFTASHESIFWCANNEESDYTFNYDETKSWPCPTDGFTEHDKQIRSVWDIPNNKSPIEQQFGHPTQKPLRVLERIIRASTNEGDVILDPFAGSGSTLVSANLNNREYIGIEKEQEYVEMGLEYLNSVTEKPDSVKAVTEVEE